MLFFRNYGTMKLCSLRAYLTRRSICDSLRNLGGGKLQHSKDLILVRPKIHYLFFYTDGFERTTLFSLAERKPACKTKHQDIILHREWISIKLLHVLPSASHFTTAEATSRSEKLQPFYNTLPRTIFFSDRKTNKFFTKHPMSSENWPTID